MSNGSTIEYHLGELKVALDPQAPGHVLPVFEDRDRVVLDIGCGIGQTLIASDDESSGRVLVGIDVDQEPLKYGRKRFGRLAFVRARGETLPFHDSSFDMVISRVALPYTMLAQSLPEISRVLHDGGRVWFSLHSFSKTLRHLARSLKVLEWKDVIFQCYVIVNGLSLHLFKKQFRFPVNGSCESFQTASGMRKMLAGSSFTDITLSKGRHFLCMARKNSRRRQA